MATAAPRRPRRLPRRVYLRRRVTVAVVAAVAVGGPVWAVAGPDGESAGPVPTTTTSAAPTTTAPSTTTTADPLGSGNPVTIAFGGDVHFERSIEARLLADPSSVMALVAPTLSAADLAVVNLETAVTEGGTPAPKQFTFRAPPAAFDALQSAGVDVASVANNHGMDYGVDGLEDTLDLAASAGFPVIGAGRTEDEAYAPFRTTVDGQRIAVIAATQVLDDFLIDEWTAEGDEPGLASAKRVDRLVEEVRAAREDSDTVVVFLHWGVEQQSCPTEVQQDLAGDLVAAGADLVVGGHAHVLQGAGMLGDAFVAYGLGNFTFMERTPLSVNTGVLEVTVTGRRVDGYRFLPGVLVDGLHHPLEGDEADAALAYWDQLRECTDLDA
ncbi:MAG TPA: CapA family protein [Acidimicrobiales bacterium]|jgi:poly-gamma-glutamate synthesis protein (capsule biosynthesis protein)